MKHIHCEAIKAWAEGATVQYRSNDSRDWMIVAYPTWSPTAEYRVKPDKPEINWDHVHETYVALTIDSHGRAILWEGIPTHNSSYWTGPVPCTHAEPFTSLIKSKSEFWKDSLVLRNEG